MLAHPAASSVVSRCLRCLVLVSGAAGVGCSGTVAREEPPDGGGGGGDVDGGGVASVDGGFAADAESPVCAALLEQSTAALVPAYQKAATNLSCTSDDDCLALSDSTSCSYGCGVVTNFTGAGVLTAAIEEQNESTCAQFTAAGCVAEYGPCAGFVAAAQCISGHCVSGLPAGWASFSIETDSGGEATSISDPVSCQGPDCTLWTVLADGTVYIQAPAGQRMVKLSAADLATVDAILRDPEFRQLELSGPFCDPPTGTQHVTMDIARIDESSELDISGCISSGPSGSEYAQLYNLLQPY